MRSFPRLEDGNCPDLLFIVLGCSDDVRQLAGIGINKMNRYRAGAEPVPMRVFELLKILCGYALPDCWGEFKSARVFNSRLYLADCMKWQDGITKNELELQNMTRADLRMIAGQCDLIERLTKERNFYKKHCGFTARHGLMLWQCFGD